MHLSVHFWQVGGCMQVEPPPLGEGEQAEIAQHFVGASLCVCLLYALV